MIGSVSSFVLPSGFNPFLAGERLKEIADRLHKIVAASTSASAQAAWEAFFRVRTERVAPRDWCDEQFLLISGDQTRFVREATQAGIPWETANATFASVVGAAQSISRLTRKLLLWWTPSGRECVTNQYRRKEWSEQDVWMMAYQENDKITKQASDLLFPARVSMPARSQIGRLLTDPRLSGLGFANFGLGGRQLAESFHATEAFSGVGNGLGVAERQFERGGRARLITRLGLDARNVDMSKRLEVIMDNRVGGFQCGLGAIPLEEYLDDCFQHSGQQGVRWSIDFDKNET